MQTTDHFQIGIILAEKYFSEASAVCRKAFILGNVFPDINFFTYFRGTLSQHKVRGHNFESASGFIKKMIERLDKSEMSSVISYFRLGKLMHYVADSFTYPHNGCFKGSLSEHIIYEEKLHREFEIYIIEHGLDTSSLDYESLEESSGVWENYYELHDSYLQNAGTCAWDIIHILKAVDMTAEALAPSCGNLIFGFKRRTA